MTTNAMTINLDDASLPTEGPAWEAMLDHVLTNAGTDDMYEAIDAEWVKDNFDISDIYDDEEILACDCVADIISRQNEEIAKLKAGKN